MCLSALRSARVRCVYDVLLCGVVMSFFGSGCGEWLVSVLGVVSRVCWTPLVGVGVSLWWLLVSCGGVLSGCMDGMLTGLSMMSGLMGLWVCKSLFR